MQSLFIALNDFLCGVHVTMYTNTRHALSLHLQLQRAIVLQIDILEVDGKYYGFSGCHRYEVR